MCSSTDAKYSCPKCEVKTCCLQCQIIHKRVLECNGVRDKTKYIPLKSMTALDFQNDYNFLEECNRFRELRKGSTAHNKPLPPRLSKLVKAAAQRRTTLRILPQNFSRNRENTTYFNATTNTIHWRVEWVFVNAENGKIVEDKMDENQLLVDLLNRYLNPPKGNPLKYLDYYRGRAIKNISLLLKAEGINNCRNRYYELDMKESLKEALVNKTIIEFPTILVVFKECQSGFDVIRNDEVLDFSREGETKSGIGSTPKNFLFSDEQHLQSSDSE